MKNDINILQLSVYPINMPRHGGQIRVSQIRKKLESLGCKVHSISISEFFPEHCDPRINFLIDFQKSNQKFDIPFCNDINISILCKSDIQILNFIKKHIQAVKPTIIFLEQPWLWPAIKRLLQENFLKKEKILIVYSSQNVEFITKQKILEQYNIPSSKIKKVCERIKALEIELTSSADYLLCTTKEDISALSSFTTREKILLLPNGVQKRKLDHNISPKLLAWLEKTNYLVFAGSSYPPNIYGFWDMLGASLARFSPEHKIVTIGGVGHEILEVSRQKNYLFHEVNKTIIQNFGQVSEAVLASVLHYSTGIILPITFGGGSNLKTAEAIAACKPIVATTQACRGYDFVGELSQFYICNKSNEFANTANDIISQKIQWKDISNKELVLRQSVYWDTTLVPLEHILNKVNLLFL